MTNPSTQTRIRLLAAVATIIAVCGLAPASGAMPTSNRHMFEPVSPFLDEGDGPELKTPLDFEARAAQFPVSGSQVLFSRCRRAPFNSNTFYNALVHETNTIVGDIPFSYADGSTCWNPQNEQNIAVNPTDDNNVVTSSNDYRDDFVHCYVYVSKDGGKTWVDKQLPGWERLWGNLGVMSRNPCGGDPVLAFAPDGTLYFAALTYAKGKSGLAVAKSSDGGITWNNPVLVASSPNVKVFHDKEWIGVDSHGRVYLTWTLFRGTAYGSYIDSAIYMSKSDEGGEHWSDPVMVSDSKHPYNQGSQVVITSSGTVVVAYEGAAWSDDPAVRWMQSALVVARSTNGGRSFTNTEVTRIYDDYSCYPLQLPGAQGRQTLTNMQFRINSFPSMALDPTTGKIAIVWADNRGVSNCGSSDRTYDTSTPTSNQVRLITSDDRGANWSGVRTITTGAADKVYPAVGANAGVISVGYYTREYSPTPTDEDRSCGIAEIDTTSGLVVNPTNVARKNAAVCLDFAMRSSADDFATQTRLTAQSSNPYVQFAGSFIGDYNGAAVDSQGRTYFVWADFRGNPGTTNPNQDVVVRRVP